jgi:RimJ/RimL family protein N-acetyltransferase
VQRANRYRRGLRIWQVAGDGGLVVLGRGLAGRWEAAYEVEPPARGRGLGTQLCAAARHLVPAGEHVWLQVAPRNLPSLRAPRSAGYTPVGAEVLMPERAVSPRPPA